MMLAVALAASYVWWRKLVSANAWAWNSRLHCANLRGRMPGICAEGVPPLKSWRATPRWRIIRTGVCFFFNPFGPKTLEAVLCTIRKSVLQKPRRIQCIYLVPTADHVFQKQDWLKLTARRSISVFSGRTITNYYCLVE